MRARRRGAIDVAVTALRRAVQLSAPSHRARRMFATAELAYERGRPDIAVPMLREIERLDLEPLDVARARFLSELMDARALADRSRVAGLIATAEQAGAAGDRELHHNLLWIAAARTWWSNPGPDTRQLIVDAADRAGPPDRRGSAAGLDPCLRRSARQRAEGPRLPARRRGQRRDGCGARRVPGLGRDRHGRLLRQPDVLRHRDRRVRGQKGASVSCPACWRRRRSWPFACPTGTSRSPPPRRPAGWRPSSASRSGSPPPRRRSR